MKRNIKRLAAAWMMLACVLTLTACSSGGEVPNEKALQVKADACMAMLTSVDQATLKAQVENLEEDFKDFEQEVALYPYIGGTGEKFDFTADAYLSILKAYESCMDDLGAYVQVKEYEGGKVDGNETTYYAVYEFEKRDMRLTLVFDKDLVINTVAVDPILTIGEILTKAALNTLLGMGSVFVVLIIICLIIYCFNFIPMIQKKFSKRQEAPAAPVKAAPARTASAAVAAEPEVDDLEVIAVITAAVAAAMGTASTDGFTVRSIRRSSSNKWRKA